MAAARLEITDLLWSVDHDGKRTPVLRADVADLLTSRGQHRAARIVSRMPSVEGVLDPDYLDELGIRVHRELQRLAEELQFHRRVADLLAPLVTRLTQAGAVTVRIVDVGCGIGYVLRAMAATTVLGPHAELVGVDLNPVLVAEATRLARAENLRCRFLHGNALEPGVAVVADQPTLVISTGLMHHLPVPELAGFFRAQARLGVAGFAHWDIAPCRWSTVGAWIFHQARMREPVSRHDGVLSARRAHPATTLTAAAAAGAPGYDCHVREGSRWHPRALDVLRPIVGTLA
jgi:SAM-dependent methyltransferase